ncbi:MAG TPA: hypothetical protein ENI34_01170 [candidate division WOR-3 bacterium]|uniref:Mutator family transposase n=1 Tax=candidate division WOR-3 bacterium TaxID=2052148 RepID=A0A9C9ELE1_UNCW3|nr:hypothetical protein [candidate division WOR-3 bacterium]
MKDKEKGKVRTITIYTIIGVTLNWKKTLVGFYLESGSEKKQAWLRIFNDLISRGLQRVSLIISDDFPGLKEVIKELFPQTDHQLCLTHFKRNITRNMSQEDSKTFKDRFSQLKLTDSFETALPKFEHLILNYQNTYKNFMAQVWLKRKQYLTFLKYFVIAFCQDSSEAEQCLIHNIYYTPFFFVRLRRTQNDRRESV